MPLNFTYHDVDGAEHQRQVNDLWPQGYRPISLTISGDPADPRYAASWLQRPGVPWVAVHGLSESQFREKRADLAPQKFVPTIVAATGPADGATFAAVFEQLPVRDWYSDIGLHWGDEGELGTINHEMPQRVAEGLSPLFFTAYGEAPDIRINCTWTTTDERRNWSWWRVSAEAYPRFYQALMRAGTRPVWVTPTPAGDYLLLFDDQRWGQFWAEHDMDDAAYRNLYLQHINEGFYLHQVQASGVGASTRYAAIFVREDTVYRRQWEVTGGPHPVLTEIDGVIQDFMRSNGIRAGSVAVARGGSVLVDHGYTWAEPGYPTTQPDTLFRLASVSKLFTAAAIDTLTRTTPLTWGAKAFPFLGITKAALASQTPDPGMNDITLDELARHTARLDHDFGGPSHRQIAGLLGLNRPPTNDDLVRYLYGVPRLPVSGYSNSAFNVLNAVVEQASRQRFVDYVNGSVLNANNLGRVFGAITAVGFRWPGEVPTYDDPGVDESQIDLAPGAVEAVAYGGAWVLEAVEGSGGLVASSATVARTIGLHAVWDYGPRMTLTRHGDFQGTCAGALSVDHDLDVAYSFNRRVDGAEHDALSNSLREIINRRAGEF